jgi:hypothetical protein
MEHRQTPLAELIAACREETQRYLRHEPSRDIFCWEIIRRAVCDRNEVAWQAFIDQYRALVLAWMRQRPVAFRLDEDGEFWVFRTFARFWRSVGPQHFNDFVSLAQILDFLKKCALSAIVDELRARDAARAESLADQEHLPDRRASADRPVLDRLALDQLRQAVLDEARTDQERLVARLCFFLAIKPAEVQALHPDLFPTRNHVYGTVRNLKERLRRNPAIRMFLEAADATEPTQP